MSKRKIDRCLICYSYLLPAPVIETKTALSDDDGPTTTAFTESSTKDLLSYGKTGSIFILRDILEIPPQRLQVYLQKYADVSPESWIRFCDRCSVTVSKATLLFKKLREYRRKFSRLQSKIVNKVLKTRKRERDGEDNIKDSENEEREQPERSCKRKAGRRKKKKKKCNIMDITGECRDFVVQHKYDAKLYYGSYKSSKQGHNPHLITSDIKKNTGFEECKNCKSFKSYDYEVGTSSQQLQLPIESDNEDNECQVLKDAEYSNEIDNEEPSIPEDNTDNSICTGEDNQESDPATKHPVNENRAQQELGIPKKRTKKAPKRKRTQGLKAHHRGRPYFTKWRKFNDKPVKYKCQQCDLCCDFVPLVKLHKHVEDHVGQTYLMKCPNPAGCLFTCSQARSIVYHLRHNKQCRESISEDQRMQYKHPPKICQTCGYNSKSVRALRHHLDRVHEKNDNKKFSCPIKNCSQQFTVRQSVLLHLPVHQGERSLHVFGVQLCDQCGERVELNEMEAHLKGSHEVQNILKCAQCPYLFSSMEPLIDHQFTHRSKGMLCNLCDTEKQIKFSSHNILRQHYFKTHNIGTKLKCELCPRTFLSKKYLQYHHKLKHRLNKECKIKSGRPVKRPAAKSLLCNECDQTFKSTQDLDDHKLKFHSSNNSVQWHTKEEDEEITILGEVFSCKMPECPSEFNLMSLLNQHLIVDHGVKGFFICELCGKRFGGASILGAHMKLKHLVHLTCVTNISGESFSYDADAALQKHSLIHSTEPFGCEVCDQTFLQKKELHTHLRKHKQSGSSLRTPGTTKQNRKRKREETKVSSSTTPSSRLPTGSKRSRPSAEEHRHKSHKRRKKSKKHKKKPHDARRSKSGIASIL